MSENVPKADCDLVIIGGGPAGLAAAINAASEGIKTTLIDSKDTLGGQASASAAIENYPGFADPVTGRELMSRMTRQASRFNTELLRPVVARGIRREDDFLIVSTEDDVKPAVKCHGVILALGLSYRRLQAKGVSDFLGRGVSYGMPVVDSQKTDQCFCVVGGANSAGQAAMHLSKIPGCKVKMLVRGESIVDSMSQYLIDRIYSTINVEVLTRTEVKEVRGGDRLNQIILICDGQERTIEIHGLYIFIGASPKTLWLNGMVERSSRGYILTGRNLTQWREQRQPFAFETSMPGVFACGDVRETSIKRVASAVGEGAAVVSSLHSYFGTLNHVCTKIPEKIPVTESV